MYEGTGCPSCDGGDKLTAITDAKGQTTTYQYDSLGRLIKETDTLGNVITYSYDLKGISSQSLSSTLIGEQMPMATPSPTLTMH